MAWLLIKDFIVESWHGVWFNFLASFLRKVYFLRIMCLRVKILSPGRTLTHTQMHTPTQKCPQKCKHPHTHKCKHTHTNANTHTQMQTHTHKCKHTHTNANTHTQMQTHTHKCKHTHTNANTHTQMHMHTCKHTHTHTHTHTHKCTHTHTQTLENHSAERNVHLHIILKYRTSFPKLVHW